MHPGQESELESWTGVISLTKRLRIAKLIAGDILCEVRTLKWIGYLIIWSACNFSGFDDWKSP
jgi:hypothetical protein